VPDQLQTQLENENTSPPRLRPRWMLKAAPLLALLVFIGIWVLNHFDRPESRGPAVTVLPNGIPAQRPSLFERLVPFSWGWLWRLKDSIFKRETILLETVGIDAKGLSKEMLAELSLGSPVFTDTNGLKVWIVNDLKLNEVLNKLVQPGRAPILFRPRIQTADGMHAQLYTGMSGRVPSGVSVGALPRIRRDFTDLSTTMMVTEAVTNPLTATQQLKATNIVSQRTNFAFSAGIQLPRGTGAFVLAAENENKNEQRLCIIITAQVPAPQSTSTSIRTRKR
jgi:hypothetical protein